MTTAQHRVVIALAVVLGAWAAVKYEFVEVESVVFFAVLIPSIILHEVSHAAAANAFGDDTAKRAGRLTLNPVPHIDPWGSVLLPAIMLLVAGGAFGYAKPVPVNQRKMRSPRNHGLLTALAGPFTNLVLIAIAVYGYRAVGDGYMNTDPELWFYVLGVANVLLAAFNLIPLPPLDGSALLERMLPARMWPGYLRFRQYSFGILILIVFVLPLDKLFKPAFDLFDSLCGRVL